MSVAGSSRRARPRAIFFGTPQFAVPCLDALTEVADVVLVVCQPDRPAGRGLTLTPPPVKVRAESLGLPVVQPTKVRVPEFAEGLRALGADFALVVAYGRILPKAVLEAPRLGCVNVHASLLPRGRGAAPIQWAVTLGDAETGVCLMQMDEGLDTGPVFARATLPIDPDETSGELFERLSEVGADCVRRELPRWIDGERAAVPQDDTMATHARPLVKGDSWLDFSQPAGAVHDRVRGMSPWPGTVAVLEEPGRPPCRVKIHRTRRLEATTPDGALPGQIIAADERGVVVACSPGAVAVTELQLEGKKRLRASEFIAGRKLADGARFARVQEEGA